MALNLSQSTLYMSSPVLNDSRCSSGYLSSEYEEQLGEFREDKSKDCGIVPVYNGQVLNVDRDLMNTGLGGISIKHYYGNCSQSVELTFTEEMQLEGEDYPTGRSLFHDSNATSRTSRSGFKRAGVSWQIGIGQQGGAKSEMSLPEKLSVSSDTFASRLRSSSSSSSFEQKPVCIRPRINHRNSFWNLHRPELCKLTWPNSYVSPATLTEHLHQHVLTHGPNCMVYHQENGIDDMLRKELDEYVRLKELTPPKEMPSDDELFEVNLKNASRTNCRPQTAAKDLEGKTHYFSDDEDVLLPNLIHRSKGEFCITVGKHVRKPSLMTVIPPVEELSSTTFWTEGDEGQGDHNEQMNLFDSEKSTEDHLNLLAVEEEKSAKPEEELDVLQRESDVLHETDYCAL